MSNKFILIYFLFSILLYPQSSIPTQAFNEEDTTKEKSTQYRRVIDSSPGFQSYEEKYAGKNREEEKKSLFPLKNGTGIWTELSPGIPRVTYFGINFFNPNIGWAVGDLGAIIKTTNGGGNWTLSETQTTTLLLKVNSYNGQVVLAAGYDGTILRSTDGGEKFVQVTSGVGSGIDLWGLQMLNDTLGWACGVNQTLLKTTDAGLTWLPVNTGFNQHYWALDFINEQFGMIACGDGKILKTINGGTSWAEYQAGDASALYSIDIIDSMHIAAAGANGKNVSSSDGGISWIQNNRLQHDELNSIRFINKETGYTIGTYGSDSWGIRKTTNRGINWFQPPVGNLSEWELELLADGIGYSAGSDLWITKTTGGYDNWNVLFLTADFVDVYFTDVLTGYAADGTYTGGPLYKTTDGGDNWFGLPNFPSNVFTSTLRCVTFTDSVTGFAGSAPARIVKTTDAGNSWYIVNRTGLTDTTGLINKIYFVSPTTGWAVTTRGGILKTTDAGENWFAQLNAGVSVVFRGVHFVDTLYGWTANVNARPYKTTDGGNNWVQQTNIVIGYTTDVHFSTPDTGWIVNDALPNALYKTNDGGLSWTLIPNIVSARNFGFFPNKSHWFVNGWGIYIYETKDGGQTFNNITNNVPSSFNRFYAPVDYLGYAVGSLGLVLKYIDTSIVPVELISFEGTIESGKVNLIWQTASELNNHGFEIQRKSDEYDWITIGFIDGNGTTTEKKHYNFVDNLPYEGKNLYRLKQIDYNGNYEYSNIVEINISIVSEFQLSQNYPNPFNPATVINYSIPIAAKVNLIVYDILGNEITVLVNEEKLEGRYEVDFNASYLPSGVYFYRLTTPTFAAAKKMLIIR
jgi:photosystem II stability/assembly factor-like uncharacterized protein